MHCINKTTTHYYYVNINTIGNNITHDDKYSYSWNE